MENPSANIHTPRLYDLCDTLTGYLVYAMVIFSPWAFGSTQDWGIWTMNIAGYCLGLLLLTKWCVRWRTGYKPYRWSDDSKLSPDRRRWHKILVRTLAGLTVLLLAYVLCQVLNARADYVWGQGRFEYFDSYIKWLPHSYDQGATLSAFWKYLALAIDFWAIRDWLSTRSRKERRGSAPVSEKKSQSDHSSPRTPRAAYGPLPQRLNRLLWVLCINGGLVALEGVLQRLSGTNKLLWLYVPHLNTQAIQQFGPWPYRGNAAAWFNLLWPLSFGFLVLKLFEYRRSKGSGFRFSGGPYILIIPCAFLLMLAAPMTSSRLGLAVTLGCLGLLALLFFVVRPNSIQGINPLIILLAPLLVISTVHVSWKGIQKRLANIIDVSPLEITKLRAFRIDLTLDIPNRPLKRWANLVSLTPSPESPNSPNSFWTAINQDGHLVFRLVGESTGDFAQKFVPDFETRYAGKEVRVTVIKTTELTITVDEQEVESQPIESGEAPEWTREIDSAFAFMGHSFSHSLNGGWTKEISIYSETRPDEFDRLLLKSNFEKLNYRKLFDDTGRTEIYMSANQMSREFPIFGVGLEAFPALNLTYKPGYALKNAAKVHDDWLEARVAVGWVGFSIIVIILITGAVISYVSLSPVWHFKFLQVATIIGLFGCLVHAKFDFPLQIVSIGFLFVATSSTLDIP